jgi:hypothetical protein
MYEGLMDFLPPVEINSISLLELIRNLGAAVTAAVIWALVVKRARRVVGDGSQYLPIFLLLIPSMVLIITVIKGSLALSLGLVGALSIVRFRTPIKEPEELLYLFIAIAVGLGLGANQLLITAISFAVFILAMVPFMFAPRRAMSGRSCYVDLLFDTSTETAFTLTELATLIESQKLRSTIKRVVDTAEHHEVTLEVDRINTEDYDLLKRELLQRFPSLQISLVDNARVVA